MTIAKNKLKTSIPYSRRRGNNKDINKPKISVIIPVYNVKKYIKQTVDNILCQSFTNLELILVLDCPTDNTNKIVNQIIPTDPRIRVIKQPRNMGVSAARNVGIKHATGKYLHLMDSDDLINVDFYQNLITAAESAHADIAVAGYTNERCPKTDTIFTNQIVITNTQDKLDFTNVQNDGYSWRYLINREFWMMHNFAFDENLRIFEDLAIMIKIICASDKIVLVPNSIYFYKNRSNSLISGADRADKRQKAIAVKSQITNFMNENNLVDNVNRDNVKLIKHDRLKIFGKFTLARRKFFSNGVTRVYFLGIPVMKITN